MKRVFRVQILSRFLKLKRNKKKSSLLNLFKKSDLH